MDEADVEIFAMWGGNAVVVDSLDTAVASPRRSPGCSGQPPAR